MRRARPPIALDYLDFLEPLKALGRSEADIEPRLPEVSRYEVISRNGLKVRFQQLVADLALEIVIEHQLYICLLSAERAESPYDAPPKDNRLLLGKFGFRRIERFAKLGAIEGVNPPQRPENAVHSARSAHILETGKLVRLEDGILHVHDYRTRKRQRIQII